MDLLSYCLYFTANCSSFAVPLFSILVFDDLVLFSESDVN